MAEDNNSGVHTPRTGRHIFTFEGGEYLTTMGASWFVSYCYYNKIDKNHTNWKKHSQHASLYDRTVQFHVLWLNKIKGMESAKLNTNKIGLTADEVKEMAHELLNSGCY